MSYFWQNPRPRPQKANPRQHRRLRFSKGSLAEDPRRLYVMLPYQGRTLLGEVVDVYYSGTPFRPSSPSWEKQHAGNYRLRVKYFNGEPWPLDPSAGSVKVI